MSKVLKEAGLERLVYHIKRLFIKKSDISVTPEEEIERPHDSSTFTVGDTEIEMPTPVFQRDVNELDESANDYIKNVSSMKEILSEGEGTIVSAGVAEITITTTKALEFGKDTIDFSVNHGSHSHKYAWNYILGSTFYMDDDLVKVTISGSGTSYTLRFESQDESFVWPVGETFTYDIIRPHQIDSNLTDKGWVYNEIEGHSCVKIWWKDEWTEMLFNNNDYCEDLRSLTDSKIDVLPQHFYLLPTSASNINISKYNYQGGSTEGDLVEITGRSNTWRFIVQKTANVQLYITSDSEHGIDWMQAVSKMEDGNVYFVEIVGNTANGLFGNYHKMV